MTVHSNDDTSSTAVAEAPHILFGDPECNAYRALEARVAPSVDPTAAVDVACFMTTDTVDADDEIVLPSGADLSRFEKNPVLLLCHGYGQPGSYHALPIGRVAWTKKRPNGLLAGVKFARSTAMGRDVKALFEEGMLRSFSIGFRSLESSPLTRLEASSRPDWKAAFERTGGRVLVHRRWQLLELSAVPLPANPEALVANFQAKGRPVPSWLQLHPTPEARMKDADEDDTLDETPGLEPESHAERPHADDDRPEAEPVDDDDDDDEGGGFRRGDHVTIEAPHYRGAGVVEGVHRRGHVPHVAEDVVGTPCAPAARVKCYKAMGDGHVPTEHHVGVRCDHITKRAEPLRPPSTRAKSGRVPAADPLPPLEALSDDEVQRQALETLGRLPRLVDEAIARYMGVV